MSKISLSPRLSAIASMVDGPSVADVGCDHGKLVRYLADLGVVNYAVVSDISKPSLSKAVTLLSDTKLQFDYVCADGIPDLALKCKQVVIAGMGGMEIIKILDRCKPKHLVLQPQHNQMQVKEYLLSNNYHIQQDIIVKEGNKYYNIIKCTKYSTREHLSEYQLHFGTNESSHDFASYIDYQLTKTNALLSGKLSEQKRAQISKYLQLLQIAKNKLENN